MQVPKGVSVDMKTGKSPSSCGGSGQTTLHASPFTNANPFQPTSWKQDMNMTFRLQPGHMITCGDGQTYLGADTDNAKYSETSGVTLGAAKPVRME